MKHTISLLMVFLFAASFFCFADPSPAEKKHPIDVIVEKMMDQDSSTAGMIQALAKGCELWDKELNKQYSILVKLLANDKEAIQELKESQNLWLKHRDAEKKLIASIYGKKEGTMYRPMAVEAEMELIKQRTIQITNRVLTIQD
ncbi:MAG: DUF1311 domain-containing protein [Candidatus Riflebacteria bacterium]|nr:DUF1311 domain-containing protein [Candidatus Riflebacteria bacterium]